MGSVKDVEQLVISGTMKKKKTKPNLALIWASELHVATNKYVAPLTAAQQGQLKHFAKACPEGTAGEVLKKVVRNWGSFANQVMANKGQKQGPLEPQIGYLLTNVGEAVEFAKQAMEPSVKKGLVSPKKAVMVPVPAVQLNSHVKATPEELAKILQSDE